MIETLLTPQDLSVRWQVKVARIYNAATRGVRQRGTRMLLKLPCIKLGKYTRFRESDVQWFLEPAAGGKIMKRRRETVRERRDAARKRRLERLYELNTAHGAAMSAAAGIKISPEGHGLCEKWFELLRHKAGEGAKRYDRFSYPDYARLSQWLDEEVRSVRKVPPDEPGRWVRRR